MIVETIPIVVTRDTFLLVYLRLRTLHPLSPLELTVLETIARMGTIGRKEKKVMAANMSISGYNLNNVISALKRKNAITHNTDDRTYYIPNLPQGKVDQLVFQFKHV